MRLPEFLWATLFLAASAGASADPVTIIHAGRLLAVPGEEVRSRQSLIIDGDRIVEVRDGFVAPTELDAHKTIDLSGMFVLPGLIDLHVHLTSEVKPGGILRTVTQSDAELAITAAWNALRNLEAGFTTVLDMGEGHRAHEIAVYAVRAAVESGRIPGPRILAVGTPISAEASSRTASFRKEVESSIPTEAVCSGADDCRRAVREQVRRGADVISFYNSGSLLSKASPSQTLTDEEMGAIVETAHALGRKVVADGGNTRDDAAGINGALRAGVDWIDTVTYPDDLTWELLLERGVYFVPHLYALHAAVGDTAETLDQGTMYWLPRSTLQSLYELKQESPSAREAYRRGVQFAFGSDPGVFPHGDNAGEFAALVREGLSVMEAVQAATINAASALGLQDQIGTLEAGKYADLIAVSGDPLEDVSVLNDVRFVMREGTVFVP